MKKFLSVAFESDELCGGNLFWQLVWSADREIPILRATRDKELSPVMISPALAGPHEGEYLLWWPEGNDIESELFKSVYDAAMRAEELFSGCGIPTPDNGV